MLADMLPNMVEGWELEAQQVGAVLLLLMGGNTPCLTAATSGLSKRDSLFGCSLLCGAIVVFIAATQHQTLHVVGLVSPGFQLAVRACSKAS
jgi:hypothetical protein